MGSTRGQSRRICRHASASVRRGVVAPLHLRIVTHAPDLSPRLLVGAKAQRPGDQARQAFPTMRAGSGHAPQGDQPNEPITPRGAGTIARTCDRPQPSSRCSVLLPSPLVRRRKRRLGRLLLDVGYVTVSLGSPAAGAVLAEKPDSRAANA